MIFENIYENSPVLTVGAASTLKLSEVPIDNGIVNFRFRIISRQPGNTRPPITQLQVDFQLQAKRSTVTLKLKEMLQSAKRHLIPDSYGFLPHVIISAECQEDTAEWESSVIYGKCTPFDFQKLSQAGIWWTMRPQEVRTFIHGEEKLTTLIPQIKSNESLNVRVLTKVYFRFLTPHEFLLENFDIESLFSGRFVTIDCSYNTIRALAAIQEFDDIIAAYDIYIEGYEQNAQRFIVNTNQRVKEFRFRNSLGIYDYIYAVGEESQELQTEVGTFTNSGVETETSNTSKLYFNSNSGYIDTSEQIRFWNNFLESDERYVLDNDKQPPITNDRWHKIAIDEAESKTKNGELNAITFKWHFAEDLGARIAKRESMLPYIKMNI